MGNRTQQTINGSTTTYYYDYVGRMTQAGTTPYYWDGWGNLTHVGTTDYYYWDDADRMTKYDGSGTANDTAYQYAPGSWKRTKRDRDSANHYVRYFGWDGANMQGEYNPNGTAVQTYNTPGLDYSLSTKTGGNTYYYYHDGEGNVRNVADSSQTTQNVYDYRPYGTGFGTQTTPVSNPYRYRNAYSDTWEGPMTYMRNRYYLQAVGLFASRDALWADAARRWGYAWNNPLSLWDPFGLDAAWYESTYFPGHQGIAVEVDGQWYYYEFVPDKDYLDDTLGNIFGQFYMSFATFGTAVSPLSIPGKILAFTMAANGEDPDCQPPWKGPYPQGREGTCYGLNHDESVRLKQFLDTLAGDTSQASYSFWKYNCRDWAGQVAGMIANGDFSTSGQAPRVSHWEIVPFLIGGGLPPHIVWGPFIDWDGTLYPWK